MIAALGFDPGLAELGWAFLRSNANGFPMVVEAGMVRTPPSWDEPQRFEHIIRQAAALVARLRPAAVGIEAFAHQGRIVDSIFVMPRVIGDIETVAILAGIPRFVIPTGHAKQAVGLRPNANKSDVKRAVERLLHVELPNEHERDAAAVAVAAIRLEQRRRFSGT